MDRELAIEFDGLLANDRTVGVPILPFCPPNLARHPVRVEPDVDLDAVDPTVRCASEARIWPDAIAEIDLVSHGERFSAWQWPTENYWKFIDTANLLRLALRAAMQDLEAPDIFQFVGIKPEGVILQVID
jgi:hypothetical protein